jgi:YesN/AraC family two-component response regulator
MEGKLMNTNKELNYHLYVQKENDFSRLPYQNELSYYRDVQSGDIDKIKKNFALIKNNFMDGRGTLSDDPVRNLVYHFVVAVSLISRFCIEGGMSQDLSYTLADIYIQRADKCKDCDEVFNLFEEMQVDYASRMRSIKKENVYSIHIRKAMDYIYEHLHEKITVSQLAKNAGLNSTYLSKLFIKETGENISDFITKAKVTTAENMLKFSEFSYLEIALSLGFSSQSYFISTFKKVSGMTPKEYREKHYKENIVDSKE